MHNLYDILTNNPFEKTIQLANASHEVFQAHFPTNPILPGFLQITLIEELFNIDIITIKKAKFLQVIAPNAILVIQKENNKILIHNKNQTKISEIIYE